MLDKNYASTKPERMVFFDTETVPGPRKHNTSTQNFRLAVGCYWRKRRDGKPDTYEWRDFGSADDFWTWCTGKTGSNSSNLLIAHNLAFDLLTSGGLKQLADRGWMLILLYECGMTRILKWGMPNRKLRDHLDAGHPISEFQGKRWTKTLTAIDNCNLFAGSIEEWGKHLGLPKLKMPDYDGPDTEWFPYCRRDVEIMVKLWGEWFTFLEEHDMGSFRLTIGSQAFSAFRHKYMHNKIEIHDNVQGMALEREAYFGGRTEAFYVGSTEAGPFYKLDVNSMYPYVMQVYSYPTRLKGVERGITRDGLRERLKRWGVIANVELFTPAPAFPFRDVHKNIYPIGHLHTTLCTPELVFALENDWIADIHNMAIYAMRPIFRWYVNAFYRLKVEYEQQGDSLHRRLIKLLLNSLYGKFGQRGYNDRIIGTCDPDEYSISEGMIGQTRQRLTIYKVGGVVIESIRQDEGYNSFAAISAHVTAYARLYLYRLIVTAGEKHCYYCDTDSLIVDRIGYENLKPYIDPSELGKLKLEGCSERLEIRAPKDYTFDAHDTRKGIRNNAVDLGDNTFEQEHWRSIKSHLSHGRISGFVNDYVTKHLRYEVDWGEKGDDGWVKPFYLGEMPLFV